MRKINWLIILFIVIIWLSISRYWTGNESSEEKPSDTYSSSNNIEMTPSVDESQNEIPEINTIISSISATPIATPSSTTPTTKTTPTASPTVANPYLQY